MIRTQFKSQLRACGLIIRLGLVGTLLLAGCASGEAGPSAFRATLPPAVQNNAPVYTATPVPSSTPTSTATPTTTPTVTPTTTPTLAPTVTRTPTTTPTVPLWTLTPALAAGASAPIQAGPASFAPTTGWSCDDFPCDNDVAGFVQRIRVPAGFTLEHVTQLPGQALQITYGPDGLIYATVLEGGTRMGAVYVVEADGRARRYSGSLNSPFGLAFQPGTAVLYVSARVMLSGPGGLFRIPPGGGVPVPILNDLPCCFSLIDNQPAALTFGPDGYLYLGVGSLTDRAESSSPRTQAYADILPTEAAVLRIQPHTGEVEAYASGIRFPADLAFDPDGQLYATDSGLLTGQGDRLLKVDAGGHYGWPYWRSRGCENCPLAPSRLNVLPDLLAFPDFSLPRGLTAYNATQFPANYFGSLFIALWNGTPEAQRVVRVDPRDRRLGSLEYQPEPFVTGLIRPMDVTVAPDGSLVVVDYVYGHVWRVRYTG